MFLNFTNVDECLKIFNGEKTAIPLVVHQNYINCVSTYGKNNNNLKLINDIAQSISISNLIAEHVFFEQTWDMQEIYGFFSFVYPTYMISKDKLNTNVNTLKFNLKYPNDMNRTTIKSINKKNITNVCPYIKNMDIDDYIYAGKLVNDLLEKNKLDKCADILNGYCLNKDNVESLLKINKINCTKTNITTDIKNKLGKLMA